MIPDLHDHPDPPDAPEAGGGRPPSSGAGRGARALRILAGALLFLPARLPPRLLRACGGLAGDLFYLASSRRRRIAVVNVERAQAAGYLPADLAPRRVARLSFAAVARTVLEAMVLHQRGLAPFRGGWRLEGRQNALDALALARARGGGLVFLTAHMGPWELAPHVMRAEFGVTMAVVGRGQGRGILDRLMVESRTGTGNTFIYKDRGAREMLAALRGGGCLGTLVDQAAVVEREGAELEFMGRPARTNLGPFKLAARTGAPLLPLFGRREGGTAVFEIHPCLTPPEAPEPSWPREAAQKVNDLLGEAVRRRPGEWMWGHRRWKTPEGIRGDPDFF